jgi:hypothetical protein
LATTRQLLTQEEEKLHTKLFKIYQRIQRDLDNKTQWSDIQHLYHKQIDDNIRAAITTIYEISTRKTVERDIKVPYYLTQEDFTNQTANKEIPR